MSSSTRQPGHRRSCERGSIIIMTAISMLFLLLLVGLCVDVSRIYMGRAELQNAADAAALTAARELNGGTSGIDDAITRANAIVNTRGFGKAAVGIASVEFAVTLNGTYMNATDAKAPGTVKNIRYVRVTTQAATTNILFAFKALGTSHTESSQAVAGMSVPINTICDFFPVAVALTDPNPAPNTTMTLNFVQGNGNSMTVADKDYIILEVPEISGNGTGETIRLGAGLTSICQTLNTNVPFHATPSANQNNGPRDISDGVNTRFNMYANGPGQLNPTDFPPDSNVQQSITFDQYDNRTTVTPPSSNGPGADGRRILIVPIVTPNTYTGTPVSAPTIKFGAFFLKKVVTVQNPCSKAGNSCAKLEVEWIDEKLVTGRGSFTSCTNSTLAVPVLYK